MSKINLIDDIMRNTDDDIIEFLTEEVGRIRMAYNNALQEKSPELIYASRTNLEIVYGVLKALRSRNAEKHV